MVLLENWPARQREHAVALPAATLPGLHGRHAGLPEAAAKVPGRHPMHERASGETAVPGGHGLASVRLALMMEPGAAAWQEEAPLVEGE